MTSHPESLQLNLFAEADLGLPAGRRSADDCPHPKTTLLRLNCGASGIQYREYCLTCWADLRGAIRHADALVELGGKDAPWGDLDVLHAARDAWSRRSAS